MSITVLHNVKVGDKVTFPEQTTIAREIRSSGSKYLFNATMKKIDQSEIGIHTYLWSNGKRPDLRFDTECEVLKVTSTSVTLKATYLCGGTYRSDIHSRNFDSNISDERKYYPTKLGTKKIVIEKRLNKHLFMNPIGMCDHCEQVLGELVINPFDQDIKGETNYEHLCQTCLEESSEAI